MAGDDQSSDGSANMRRATVGTNIISLKDGPVLDIDDKKEEIRRMAEVGRLNNSDLEELRMVYPGMRRKDVLNAFRELRMKLYALAAERNKNFTLLVTSITPHGGSSFVTLNLGAVIALDESKTAVVVDCNIYEPSLHKLLPVEPDFGLVDYLENISLDVKDIIYSTGIRRLRVIPTGSHNMQQGTEVLTSSRMRRFVQEVSVRYRDRYVIIDGPPMGETADAHVLMTMCDYVLLVVPFGAVTPDVLKSHTDAIPKEKLLGVVLNYK